MSDVERKDWQGKLTRIEAIQLLDKATDRDDPFWEDVIGDLYDEDTDTMPSVYHVFVAIGITKEEYMKASGADNVDWPTIEAFTPSGADCHPESPHATTFKIRKST